FWCITDWQRVFDVAIEKTVEKDRLLEKLKAGGFDEKAIVVRLSNNDCVIGMDDDPKIYGYSLRLIKNDK
ncbi:hypothetical protein N9E43_02750, partial [Salibacteraceae bacterium]|nr:hypothetical protein [Salibacteraceae bacterium]